MNSALLEVCVDTVDDAVAARDAGAHRIELCATLELGGLTPSYGLTARTMDIGIPVFAMIRPHAGDFIYSESEVSCMLADIEAFRSLGVSGLVFGALDEQRNLDERILGELISACSGLPSTLHRAFDVAAEPFEALEKAVELGFDRILTSGGAASVLEGMPILKKLFAAAAARIIVMPGGGVSPATIYGILAELAVRDIHASCKKVLSLKAGGPSDLNVGRIETQRRYCTDPDAVRELLQALDSN